MMGLGGAEGFMLGFWLGLLIATGYLVVAAFRVRVVLHADLIENYGVFAVQQMQRHDVRGYRLVEGSNRIQLVSRHPGMNEMTLASYAVFDWPLQEWLNGVPNLDQE